MSTTDATQDTPQTIEPLSEEQRAGLGARLQEITQRMHDACARAGRSPDEVRLVAVSKTFSAAHILALYELGVRDFGESYVQEFLQKQPLLPADIRWHFIGHLQSNKIRSFVDLLVPSSGAEEGGLALIHAVDRASLMKEIARRIPLAPVLLQVNIGGESSKSGVDASAVHELLASAIQRYDLQVRGLMTIPPPVEDPEDARAFFAQLREAQTACTAWLAEHAPDHPGVPILSMGMSHDFEIAIEEGATHVRVGSALFGARRYT